MTTFDELHKRVQDDIRKIQQIPDNVNGGNGETRATDGGRRPESSDEGHKPDTGLGSGPVRTSGGNETDSGSGELDGISPASGESGTDGGPEVEKPSGGLDNVDGTDEGGVSTDKGINDGRRGHKPSDLESGKERDGRNDDVQSASGPDTADGRLSVKLGDEKVYYPNRSKSETLMSVILAKQVRYM